MPRNGSGIYTLPQPPFVPGTAILSAAVNSDLSDIATAMTQSVSNDGQTPITGTLKSSVTTMPAYGSTLDATTGFVVSAAGEADILVGNAKIVAVTATGESVTGNLSASGTLSATGTATLGTVTATTATITTATISGILTDSNTGYWVPPTGTTAQRPGSPSDGWSRYNKDNHQWEFWNSSAAAWQVLAGIFAPNFQTFTSGSSATYTTPTAGGTLPLYLRVRMVGGGGGGGAQSANNGTNGGDTSFSGWSAIHGNGGANGGPTSGGAGGTGGVNGTGTLIGRVDGAAGGMGTTNTSGGSNFIFSGGYGGGSPWGGAGAPTGGNASANSGAGGAGGRTTSGAGQTSGGGGGAGEFVEFIITSPASSYTYTVGAQGNGGAAGGQAGGNGAAGRIEVTAFWQ